MGQYAGFSGRARRSEYWFFSLFSFLVGIVFTGIDAAIGSSILGGLVSLALIVPSLAVSVRRLHDTDRSGFWLFIGLVPLVGGIVLLVFFVQESKGPNAHGPSPKGITGDYAQPVGS